MSDEAIIEALKESMKNIGGEDTATVEGALAKAMLLLANPNRQQIKWFSDLPPEFSILLSQFAVKNRFSKDRYTTQFIEDILDYSVSIHRKGRTELKEVFEKMAMPRDSPTDRLAEMLGRKH